MLKAQCETLRQELIGAKWNIAAAAKAIGVSRITVYRLVRKFKLMKPGKVMVRRLVKA